MAARSPHAAGLCFALHADRAGYAVHGVDINESYVASLNARTFRSAEPGVSEALRGASDRLRVFTDTAAASACRAPRCHTAQCEDGRMSVLLIVVMVVMVVNV